MNEDISELLEIVKKDIVLVENGDESPERLSELSDVFQRMLELIKLFLISERDSYYGYFLVSMSIQTDFYSESITGILLNTFPPVFFLQSAAAGKIYAERDHLHCLPRDRSCSLQPSGGNGQSRTGWRSGQAGEIQSGC